MSFFTSEVGSAVTAAENSIALNRNMMIEFKSVPTGKTVYFKGFITEFSDQYTANWNPETVYGRMDEIMTFQGTKREVNFSWDIVAASYAEAVSNLAKLEVLMAMLYPVYNDGIDGVLNAAPLMRIRFANFALETPVAREANSEHYSSARGYNVTREGEERKWGPEQIITVVPPTGEGLLGAVRGFNYKPNLEHGTYMGNGMIFPKIVNMNCGFGVLHTEKLGWTTGAPNPDGVGGIDVGVNLGGIGNSNGSQWRGSKKWPYGVGGLAQKIPGVPNSMNPDMPMSMKQAMELQVTGGGTYKEDSYRGGGTYGRSRGYKYSK